MSRTIVFLFCGILLASCATSQESSSRSGQSVSDKASPPKGPSMRFVTDRSRIPAGETFEVTVFVDTAGRPARGGAITLTLDGEALSADSPLSFRQPENPPYALTPPPRVTGDKVEIVFMSPSFEPVAGSGELCTFVVNAVSPAVDTGLMVNDPTRFAPDIGAVSTNDIVVTVTASGS